MRPARLEPPHGVHTLSAVNEFCSACVLIAGDHGPSDCMFSRDFVTNKTRDVHPWSREERLLRYMMASGHVESAVCELRVTRLIIAEALRGLRVLHGLALLKRQRQETTSQALLLSTCRFPAISIAPISARGTICAFQSRCMRSCLGRCYNWRFPRQDVSCSSFGAAPVDTGGRISGGTCGSTNQTPLASTCR